METTMEKPQMKKTSMIADFIRAQYQIKNVEKDKENTYFHSSYSTITAVSEGCKSILNNCGFGVIQTVTMKDGVTFLVTTLAHISGDRIESFYPLFTSKANDPQALGSAVTYARRYSLMALVGMCPEDDDGNTASEPGKAAPQHHQATTPPATTPSSGNFISDGQKKRFYAIWNSAGKTPEQVKEYLKLTIGVDDSRKIPIDKYDACCSWAESKV